MTAADDRARVPGDTGDEDRQGFSPLLVPVDGHTLACQTCGALVLDNPNAVRAHKRSHRAEEKHAALIRDLKALAGDIEATFIGGIPSVGSRFADRIRAVVEAHRD